MKKELSSKQQAELLDILKARFEKNMNRHKGIDWAKVQAKLEAKKGKLWSLNEMEAEVCGRCFATISLIRTRALSSWPGVRNRRSP